MGREGVRMPPHPTPLTIIGDVAVPEWLAGPASYSRFSEHTAHLCSPPAGTRRATLAGQPTPCREKTTGFFQVSLAINR